MIMFKLSCLPNQHKVNILKIGEWQCDKYSAYGANMYEISLRLIKNGLILIIRYIMEITVYYTTFP
jgi:hypothetical protein